MTALDHLQQAVQQLYNAFDAPRPLAIDGCPCCTTPQELRELVVTPLRQLDSALLGRYAFKAMSTMGSEQDYLYFLPAILEEYFLAGGILGAADLDLIIYKAVSCGLNAEQQKALQDVLQAWWLTLLDRPDAAPFLLWEVLACAYVLGQSWQPYLAAWDGLKSEAATVQLAAFFIDYATTSPSEYHHYLDDAAQPQLERLHVWLHRPEVAQRLEEAFFADPDGPNAWLFSRALEYLG